MNLAQMKTALENSVTDALKQSLDPNIEVVANYDANTGTILAELKRESEIQDNRSNILCYTIQFVEETKETTIVAFNRNYIHDGLGIAIVNNEPVAISSKFIADIAQIIEFGIDRGYHPENYQPVEEAQEQAEEEVIDGNAE
jgi:hypothetical protein